MLLILRQLSPADGRKMMDIYQESNEENIDCFYPGATDRSQALAKVEADFLRFIGQFLSEEKNTYYVWEENGEWVSALRLTRFQGFCYLEALETRPDCRRKDCGEALLRAVLDHLKQLGPVEVRDCVSKKNLPSLTVHQKCGFAIESQAGVDYLDGSADNRCYGMVYRC